MTQPPQRPVVGIGLAAVAVLFFALADTLTKWLTETHPVPVVMAGRYLASLALPMVFVWPRQRARLWRTERFGLVLLRGAILALASLTLGLALRVMPVAEAVAILYLSPFAVIALAVPLLGERIGPLGWFLAVLGFCGVLLVLRPGGGLDPVGVIWALLNAACATAYHLITRLLTRTETTLALLFHVTTVGAAVFTVLALPHLNGAWPGPVEGAAMLLLGLIATLGHGLFAAAYREAPAGLIAPVNYMHLVWAALLGLIVFGDWPTPVTLVGMAMIIGSGVAIALTARQQP